MKALERLSSFQTLGEKQLIKMQQETARFMTAYSRHLSPYWLSLVGKSATGKTMLAKLIYKNFDSSRFLSWARIVRELRSGEYRWFEDLFTERLLIIDDIGAEYETGFIAAKLYELLNERGGRWTILTSNLSLKAIGDLDVRIASRMIRDGSVVVDVNAPDWSTRKPSPTTGGA